MGALIIQTLAKNVSHSCSLPAGGAFVRSLADALHPQHGTIVVNMHCGPRPRLGENLLRQLRGLPPLTFDEGSPEAAEVIRYAGVLKCELTPVLSGMLHAVNNDGSADLCNSTREGLP